jgi:hypothetical protein
MKPEMSRYTISLAAPATEMSHFFMQGMANRMAISYYKYGPVADGYPSKVSAIKSLSARIDAYTATGNTEYLIDAANFAMIEFMHPSIGDAYFTGTDSDFSPGRIAQTGRVSFAANDEMNAAR